MNIPIHPDIENAWWRTHDNIVTLAYWMRENNYDVDTFVSLIEKPWKWTDEYEQAMADNAAEEAAAEAEMAERIASTQAVESPVETIVLPCIFCGMALHKSSDGTWVDMTDGDGCSGDDNLVNENGSHRPRYLKVLS